MLITLSTPDLEAQVSAHGAELGSLRDEGGRDLLWDGDPAFWTGRSPLLFPIVGRVRNDRIRVDGAEYVLKQHGSARNLQFEVIEASESFCRLRLDADATTREHYPFDFRLDVAYKIENGRLLVTVSIANLGSQTMPASFGFHPASVGPYPMAGLVRLTRFGSKPLKQPPSAGLSTVSWDCSLTPARSREIA